MLVARWRHKPWGILGLSLAVLVTALAAGWWQSAAFANRLLEQERARIQNRLNGIGTALAAEINQRHALVTGLGAFVASHAGTESFRDEFELYAAGLHANDPVIRAIQVFPPTGPVWAYPAGDNAAVLDRTLNDLLQDDRPAVRADVQRTVRSRRIALSNPYELRQGGKGVVARLAVYREDTLWGLVTVILNLDPLLNKAGIGSGSSDLQIALKNSAGQVFYGSNPVFFSSPALHEVTLPVDGWTLAALPREGWLARARPQMILFRVSVLLGALLLGGVTCWIAARQAALARTVRTQTRELGERKEDYRLLFDHAADGIFITAASGHCVEVNPSGCALLGCSREEALRLKWTDLFAAATPADASAGLGDAAARRGLTSEGRLRRRDGTTREVEINARALPDGRTQALVRDATERKRRRKNSMRRQAESRRLLDLAEQSRRALLSVVKIRNRVAAALRESEARFRLLLAYTPDHVFMQDRELRYQLVVNPQLGLTEADMLGKTDGNLLSPADAEKLIAIKRQVLETGLPIRL